MAEQPEPEKTTGDNAFAQQAEKPPQSFTSEFWDYLK